MEALIVHCHTIFDEQIHAASYGSSPPLPPAPLGESAPSYPYGSAYTTFAEHGSQQYNAPLPQTPTSQSALDDDFTPQLPPRPPPSIHPSSRGNTGSSNGHSNPSPVLTEAETSVSSPTSYIPSPPLLLRPGRQGGQTPIQSLRGTKGLDFSQPDISEGDWIGPAPSSPPLSDSPSPPPSAFRSPRIIPPTPSALPQSTFALQQQQPPLAQILTQEVQTKAQPPPTLPVVEKVAAEELESFTTSLETPQSAMEDDGHSTKYESPITSDPPTGPTLQPVTTRPLTQQVPQVPIQVAEGQQQQSQPPPTQSIHQPEEVPQGRHESQEETPPSQLQ